MPMSATALVWLRLSPHTDVSTSMVMAWTTPAAVAVESWGQRIGQHAGKVVAQIGLLSFVHLIEQERIRLLQRKATVRARAVEPWSCTSWLWSHWSGSFPQSREVC